MASRAIGTVAVVEPGVEVWSKTRVARDLDPVGGIVLYVTEHLDRQTGEVDRAFVCLDHTRTQPWLRWSTIPETDVDPHSVASVDTSTLVRLWRRLGHEIAYSLGGKQRRGPATVEEARAAEALLVLVRVVFGPDGVYHGMLTPPRAGAPADERPTPPPNVAALID